MSKVVIKVDEALCIRKNEEKRKQILPMLKNEIVKTTEPYVPFDSGELAHSVYASINDGTERLVYRKIYAHFLYVGLVMIGTISGKAWANKYEKKSYTTEKLKYRKTHPKASSFWFEESKKKNEKHWIKFVKELFK